MKTLTSKHKTASNCYWDVSAHANTPIKTMLSKASQNYDEVKEKV